MSEPTHARSRTTTNSDNTHIIRSSSGFPDGLSRETFVAFLVEHLVYYGDPPEDINSALDYVFSDSDGRGGVLIATVVDDALAGAMVVTDTGMSGFIPEHHLVYFAVDSSLRGRGLGTKMINVMAEVCPGSIALHVEPDNPARALYERLGFTTKYVEMRLHRSG